MSDNGGFLVWREGAIEERRQLRAENVALIGLAGSLLGERGLDAPAELLGRAHAEEVGGAAEVGFGKQQRLAGRASGEMALHGQTSEPAEPALDVGGNQLSRSSAVHKQTSLWTQPARKARAGKHFIGSGSVFVRVLDTASGGVLQAKQKKQSARGRG